VAVLATIVLVRIVLSWSLAIEIDGVWPWRKRSLASDSEEAKDGHTGDAGGSCDF
jgi:hypothetical protein